VDNSAPVQKAWYKQQITSQRKMHMPTKVTTRGTLKIFIKQSFEKNGETVEYSTAYFVCEDAEGSQSVLKVNTKKDLTDMVDEAGEISLQVRPDGSMQLVRFA